MAHGGKRAGAGRKPKVEEQELIERLSPLDDVALEALKKGLKSDESWAVKLFMEYRYGKPKQTINQTNTHTFDNFDLKDLYGKDKKA